MSLEQISSVGLSFPTPVGNLIDMTTTNTATETETEWSLINRADAGDMTILTVERSAYRPGRGWTETVWTIVNHADGIDRIVTPRGEIINPDHSTDSRIDSLCFWVANADI